MNRHKFRLIHVLPCTFFCAFGIAQTVPPGYEIVDITSNNGRSEEVTRINNHGQLVFSSRIPGSLTDSEIWLYDSRTGELTQITDDDVYDISPDINDEGDIVWSRSLGPWDPRIGIFTFEIMLRTADGTVTRITDHEEHDVGPRINHLRQIVWQRSGPWACGGPTQDVYLYDGARVVPITTNGAPESLENQSPVINDLGQIIWAEYDFCDPPPPYNFTSRIMFYDDGEATALPHFGVTAQIPDLNNSGQAAWQGFDPVLLRQTVEVWDGFETTLLTDRGSAPSINEVGDIALSRWDPITRIFSVWLVQNGEFIRLVDEPVHNAAPSINDEAEIAWVFGETLNLDVRLLRRMDIGDLNCDGAIDAFDIEPFVLALVDPVQYQKAYPGCNSGLADTNEDGRVDSFDIEPFIRLVIP